MDNLRPIEGFPGYFVSKEGFVFSNKRGELRPISTSKVASSRYVTANLYCGDKRKTKRLYRLVAVAWLGPRPQGAWIDFVDGNPLNHHADNLVYRPAEERGESRQLPKLTPDAVREIRSKTISLTALAEKYQRSLHSLQQIRRGERYKWVK